MARLGFALLLSSLTVFAQVYWYEQTPPLARAGQPVKVRVRADGMTRFSFEPDGGGAAREFTSLGGGLFEVEVTAPAIEARHLFQRFAGFARGFNGTAPGMSVNVVLLYGEGLPAARVVPLAADAQRSDHILNIHSKAFYDRLLQPSGFLLYDGEPVSRRAYQLVGDDYDFVNIAVGNLSVIGNRYHGVIRNSVRGIGMDAVDAGSTWGSARRLMGFTMFPNRGIFDGADDGYVHEQGHQWVSAMTVAPFGVGRPHWPVSSMATGVMGYSDPVGRQGLMFPCRFVTGDDGTVRVLGSAAPREFTDMDLYMMGLAPADAVGTHYVVTDAARAAAAQNGCGAVGTLQPGQFQTVNAQTVVGAYGARTPAAGAAQKDFKALTVVVSRDGLLSREEMAYFEAMSRRAEERGLVPRNVGLAANFSNAWYPATGGRSTMSHRLSSDAMPVIAYGGVVNAASFSGSALGPATVATIFGSDLARTTEGAGAVPLPQTLGGARVLVNGRPAPLFYASPGQINFQIPDGLPVAPAAPSDTAYLASVTVERDGMSSNIGFIELRAAAPGIITYGDGYAVATNTAGQVIGPSNPAVAGQLLTLYWVGAAPLSETVPAGTAAPLDRLVRVTGLAGATLNGVPAGVTFLGLTPGGVGLLQANIAVAANTPAGELPLVLNIAGRNSNTAKLPVRRP